MKIAYYMPFKPMGHSRPSGDLVIGSEIFDHLKSCGHEINLASPLRLRWGYYRPATLLRVLLEHRRLGHSFLNFPPDIWLTYHSYYKAPDLLGPGLSRKLRIPYAIFQGIYSTKRRRNLKTLPGFLLNRRALLNCDTVFTNKLRDQRNLLRLLPEEKVVYIAPGLHPNQFRFSKSARKELREQLGIGADTVVILSVAMMRPGVKTEGLKRVIESCKEVYQRTGKISLVLVGEGECRHLLEQEATAAGFPIHLAGQTARGELYRWYSMADIFAFPGIEESLGMVFLEAQSCGLPAVAFNDWGGGEVIRHGSTGLTSSIEHPELFTRNLEHLAGNRNLRRKLGTEAARLVRSHHDIARNYNLLETRLRELTATASHPRYRFS